MTRPCPDCLKPMTLSCPECREYQCVECETTWIADDLGAVREKEE